MVPKKGYAWPEDLELTEEHGCAERVDSSKVSSEAMNRGLKQIGTLGSGNRYGEIQGFRPENVFNKRDAEALGIILPNQIVIMFHCGSRGFGHQVASDYLKLFSSIIGSKYGMSVTDRELACATFNSTQG